jgi:phosphate starvation-inducible PhoH-like protein
MWGRCMGGRGEPALCAPAALPGRALRQSARALFTTALIRRHSFEDADNRRLAHLCGPLDVHLRAIEAALGVGLARRDASFRINGPREAVDRTVALLDVLYEKSRHPIGERALQLLLVKASAPGEAAVDGGAGPDEPVVLHTRHADLSGRTPNQVQYLRQMLTHDITFGIGPAGTGKTFLAVACAVDALERHGVQRIVLTRPAVEAGERWASCPAIWRRRWTPTCARCTTHCTT